MEVGVDTLNLTNKHVGDRESYDVDMVGALGWGCDWWDRRSEEKVSSNHTNPKFERFKCLWMGL